MVAAIFPSTLIREDIFELFKGEIAPQWWQERDVSNMSRYI
jgi:hypothetical protein